MLNDLHQRLLSYSITNVGRPLILSVQDNILMAYAKVDDTIRKDIKNSDPTRLRGQNRRYYIDDALSGVLAGGVSRSYNTSPKGEQYVVISSNNGPVTLSHIEQHANERKRPAKHRKTLAQSNQSFSQKNLSLFEDNDQQTIDKLHIIFIVEHPSPKARNQAEPKEIFVAVPYSDGTDYHLKMPIQDFLRAYDEAPSTEFIDQAWPQLRDDLQKTETQSEKNLG